MTSKATRAFWQAYQKLPASIQEQATQKFQLWRRDPFHPSLHFKELSSNLWSVRITPNYRALARRRDDLIVWFWIGTHDEYDRLIGRG